MRFPASGAGRRWHVLAGIALVLAWLLPAHEPNWNQNAHYALVRALADGRTHIDPSVFTNRADVFSGGTGDVAIVGDHVYAAKAPGLALWAVPAHMGLEAAGITVGSINLYRGLWLLTVWGAVVPATVLFVLVRILADQIAPGYGPITAATLAISTLLLPFASLFFAHALTAMLVFAAFALLFHERRGASRLGLVASAGALAGYAIAVELPSVIAVGALAGYLLARTQRRIAGVLAYSGGVALGVLPLLVFNKLAFGSVTQLSYASVAGGLNREGVFGVTLPSFHVASALLFSTVGLLRLAPVLALSVVGLVLLNRRGYRAEVLLIASLVGAYLVFNSGYETPFGGYSPGPRFLVPIVPFLVLPLALVYERLPVTTVVLAAASAVQMIVITITNPVLAVFGDWFDRLWARQLARTAIGFGANSGRAMPLVALLLLAAAILALLATPRPSFARRDVVVSGVLLGSWLLIAHESPTLVESGGLQLVLLYAAVTAAAFLALLVPRTMLREQRVASGSGD